ncbi:MAG TPA: histidine phosphatase family protein [Acidimicrobiales bacterium]|nr:histidine phosphatase family protein [Acidimicrobiales bacterium]
MKRLYLLRHAKSSWDDASLADDDRPLAPRGIRALARMRKYLRKAKIRPDLVICSPARRTRQTLTEVEGALGRDVEVRIEPQVYEGGAGALVDLVSRAPDSASSVMLIGHNPSLQDLAVSLAVEGDEALRSRLAEKFPTGALAVIGVPLDTWRDLGEGRGTLEELVLPRELG